MTATTTSTDANRIATNAARAVLKALPEHTFQTGAKGRDLRTRITVGGVPALVVVQVILKPKAVKPVKVAVTVAKKTPVKKAK